MRSGRIPEIFKVVFILFLLGLSAELFARAGGGGGGDYGGGGDGGLFEIIIYLLFAIPFPYNFIVIGIIILLPSFSVRKPNRPPF
ncbi:MAG TPA: hypothetical protein PLZ67_09420 [Bacteroidales bacterium]|nr:hypothetical protein [Bacteroidales bacterium]